MTSFGQSLLGEWDGNFICEGNKRQVSLKLNFEQTEAGDTTGKITIRWPDRNWIRYIVKASRDATHTNIITITAENNYDATTLPDAAKSLCAGIVFQSLIISNDFNGVNLNGLWKNGSGSSRSIGIYIDIQNCKSGLLKLWRQQTRMEARQVYFDERLKESEIITGYKEETDTTKIKVFEHRIDSVLSIAATDFYERNNNPLKDLLKEDQTSKKFIFSLEGFNSLTMADPGKKADCMKESFADIKVTKELVVHWDKVSNTIFLVSVSFTGNCGAKEATFKSH
jgi:hypothetical protein